MRFLFARKEAKVPYTALFLHAARTLRVAC